MSDSTFWAKEPAVAVSLTVSLLALASAFGFALNHEQTVAITGAVFAVASLVAGFATRAKVSAPATVQKIQTDAQDVRIQAQNDKANIIAAIGTNQDPAKDKVPAVPDPVDVEPSPAQVLASIPPTTVAAPVTVTEATTPAPETWEPASQSQMDPAP